EPAQSPPTLPSRYLRSRVRRRADRTQPEHSLAHRTETTPGRRQTVGSLGATRKATVTSERPDFGPSGYLPPRAARRARKIMLREPLGLQWAVAAVVAGLLVLLAGAGYLLWQSRPP